MKDLVWDKSYEIGIEDIDRQHMEFIKLLRRFNVGVHKAVPAAIQLRILHEIEKYAEYHFCSEENIMFLTKYPALPTQQMEHSRLLASLRRQTEDYKKRPEKGEQLSEFLYNWFVTHTQVEDRKITAHLGKASSLP